MLASLKAILSTYKYMALFFLIGTFIGGVSGWKVGSWWFKSKELYKITADYSNLTNEFAEYQSESQKKVDEYNKKLLEEIENNKQLQEQQTQIVKEKESKVLLIQEQVDGLHKMLSGLTSTACQLDDSHQRVLERITQTANYPTTKCASRSGQASITPYLNISDFTFSGS